MEKKRGVIYFQALKGRVWPARYIKCKTESGPRFELTSGWKEFLKDNNLKVGDVCKFELILSTNMTFQVHIFTVTDKNCSTFESRIGAQFLFHVISISHLINKFIFPFYADSNQKN